MQRRIVTYPGSDTLDWYKISIILVPTVGSLQFHWFIPDASLDFFLFSGCFIFFFFFFCIVLPASLQKIIRNKGLRKTTVAGIWEDECKLIKAWIDYCREAEKSQILAMLLWLWHVNLEMMEMEGRKESLELRISQFCSNMLLTFERWKNSCQNLYKFN